MIQPTYKDTTGVLIPGRLLGQGGEGEVYALANDPTRALKIYADPDESRKAKVMAMTTAGLAAACPNVAFPITPAFTTNGAFAGFTMKIIEGGLPVHEVHSPASRRRELPNADWRFLIRIASNIVRIARQVHQAGAVIGDINGSGILVSRRAVASLIDADSFQLGPEHPCRVGVPEYTPPELQGTSLDGAERTAQHDAYGLAVLIFQLLFLGRHPAAGVPAGRDVPLTDAIRQNIFAYSLLQRSRLRPPAGTLLLSDLPHALSTLFERAFAGLGNRPEPSEWIEELDRLELLVTPCEANSSHQHVSGRPCPWCRIDAATRRATFSAADRNTPKPIRRPNERQARALATAAHARLHTGERTVPIIPQDLVPPSPAASALAPPINGPLGVTNLSAEQQQTFLKAHRKAARDLDAALDGWRRRVDGWLADRLATEIDAEVDRQFAAARRHDRDARHVDDRLRAEAISTGLRGRTLDVRELPGVGSRLIARLADAGIATAYDVTHDSLASVHGFGERGVLTLLLWRAVVTVDVERSIVLSPTDRSERRRSLERSREADLVSESDRLDVLERNLEKALLDLKDRAGRPDTKVVEAMAAYRQTGSDLRFLGISSGSVRTDAKNPPMSRQPASSKPSSARRAQTACPTCGGPMVKRWARNGGPPNRFFLGCAAYPLCNGSRSLGRRTP